MEESMSNGATSPQLWTDDKVDLHIRRMKRTESYASLYEAGESLWMMRDEYQAALAAGAAEHAAALAELKAQLAERSAFARSPVAGSLEWGTIEVALKNERAALCGCDACKLGRDSIDAALAFVREQRRVPTAPQVAPTPQADANEREIIEGMADDWLERHEPGSDEWAQAQVIRAWLDNYSGTMYAERTPVAATPQGAIPDDTTCGLCGGRGDMWDYGKENLTCPVCNGTGELTLP